MCLLVNDYKLKRIYLWGLGAFTLIGLGLIGLAVAVFLQHRGLADFLRPGTAIVHSRGWEQAVFSGKPVAEQLLRGSIYGVVVSLNALWIIYHDFFTESREYFSNLVRNMRLGVFEIILLSFCAGIGEELLFRGALQHWCGIWITAIVFIGLHGYLDPRDRSVMIYGCYMVITVAGFGYLYEQSGMIAAATAHTLVDIVLFGFLRFWPNMRDDLRI